jgi:hypothetical protein
MPAGVEFLPLVTRNHTGVDLLRQAESGESDRLSVRLGPDGDLRNFRGRQRGAVTPRATTMQHLTRISVLLLASHLPLGKSKDSPKSMFPGL